MTKKESDRVEWTLRYLLRFIREKEQQFEAELSGCTTDRETMMVLGGLAGLASVAQEIQRILDLRPH